MKRSEDAHDNFTNRKKKYLNFFFQIFICLRCIYLMIFKVLPMEGVSLPPFPPGCFPSLQAPRGTWSVGPALCPSSSHTTPIAALLSCPPVTLQGSQAGVWIMSLQRIRAPWGKVSHRESLVCTAALKEQRKAAEGCRGKKLKHQDSFWFHS